MRQVLLFIFVAMMFCFAVPVESSAKPECGLEYEVNEDGQTMKLLRVIPYDRMEVMEEYMIPATAKQNGRIYRVTRISNGALMDLPVKKIYIPEGIEEVGFASNDSGEFWINEKTEEIVFPSTIKKINVSLNQLKRIRLSEQNPYFSLKDNILYSKDGERLITSGDLSEKAEIPDGVKEIGKRAFYYYTKLKHLRLPDGVVSIGERAFSGCENLEDMNLPDSVVSIGERAFSGCANLKSINLPDSVVSIGKEAFSYCGNLESVDLPDNLVSIGKETFRGCGKLKSVVLPDGLTSIGAEAFKECGELGRIHFPDSLVSIGERAFTSCGSLKRAAFGKELKKIARGAFYKCPKLKMLTVSKKNPHIRVIKGAFYTKNKKKLLMGSVSEKVMKLPKKTVDIQKGAFDGNKAVKTVLIMSRMKKIPEEAFEGSNVHSVVLPDSLREVGDGAFCGCEELSGVVLPDSVRVIGENAFQECERLQFKKLPKSLREIKKGAFRHCKFSRLVIPKGVRRIGENALWTMIGELVFLGEKPPQIEKQEESKEDWPDDDGTSPGPEFLAATGGYYSVFFNHIRGIKVVRVPRKSYEKYRSALKERMIYGKLKKLRKG